MQPEDTVSELCPLPSICKQSKNNCPPPPPPPPKKKKKQPKIVRDVYPLKILSATFLCLNRTHFAIKVDMLALEAIKVKH